MSKKHVIAAAETTTGTWSGDPSELLRVSDGFRLDRQDASAQPGFDGNKAAGQAALASGAGILADQQERLFAASTAGDTRSILLVLQAMDTAGKGGIVGHVVGAVNPMGVRYTGFKKPTAEELSHDFLWRIRNALPGAGQIGVFDRSHYEDVLIGRVRELAPAEEIERRYAAINDFEQELLEGGTSIVKIMLHISADEQKDRLQERLDRPEKHWKYNPGDVDERMLWNDYQRAYQLVFERTSTSAAPWHVVPANKKWYARLAVQRLLTEAIARLNLGWPAADYDVAEEKRRLAAS